MSFRSCHGPGKTALLAWIIWLQLLTRFPQKTACTAPTSSQLEDALFAEVRMWYTKLPPQLQVLFEIKESGRIELRASPSESFTMFKTARPEQPEALQGIHCDAGFVLLIGDEASGIHEKIFEAAVGSMSGKNCQTILAGNPVRTNGFFHDTHEKPELGWKRIEVSAVPRDGAYTSKRVSKEFIEQVRQTYGEDSNQFRVRVLGLPPKADEDTIIPAELVDTAQDRDIKPSPTEVEIWGLDVARFGWCKTALAKRRGGVLVEPVKTWSQLDIMQVVGKVKAEWDSCEKSMRPIDICVDAIGLGAGVADRLRELGLPARAVNVSELTAMNDRFTNLRTELWWKAREWFTARTCTMPRERHVEGTRTLAQELVSLKYKIVDSSGKLRAESKDEMKRRGLNSPDKADAFVLTFASPASSALLGRAGGNGWKTAIKMNRKGVV